MFHREFVCMFITNHHTKCNISNSSGLLAITIKLTANTYIMQLSSCSMFHKKCLNESLLHSQNLKTVD